jgi:hypothetical protein
MLSGEASTINIIDMPNKKPDANATFTKWITAPMEMIKQSTGITPNMERRTRILSSWWKLDRAAQCGVCCIFAELMFQRRISLTKMVQTDAKKAVFNLPREVEVDWKSHMVHEGVRKVPKDTKPPKNLTLVNGLWGLCQKGDTINGILLSKRTAARIEGPVFSIGLCRNWKTHHRRHPRS